MALRNVLTSVGGLVMMLATSPRLTLLIIITVPLVIAPILLLGRRVRALSRASQDSLADVGQNAGESIQEIKTVQAFGQVARIQQQFAERVETAFQVARRRIFQRSLLIATVIVLVFFALSLMIWVGGRDVIQGTMSPGDLSAFVFYALLVALGAATLAEVTSEVQRAVGATERLAEFINLKQPDHFGQERMDPKAQAVTLSDIQFSYPQRSDHAVLNDLSLRFKRHQTTAVVGPSGAGKSTLFELILRFRTPHAGTVTIGEQPLDSIDESDLRKGFALVPQQPSLFSSSIRDNIAFSHPDATHDELVEAAKAAGAHEFIQALPEGYDTRVGERGVQLSGGQRQRIAIARALLHGAQWLLLDEATSALDSHSEQQIQSTLKTLRGRISTIVIAHRISTIEDADHIVVLDQGRCVDQGTHAELLATSSVYQQLQPAFQHTN